MRNYLLVAGGLLLAVSMQAQETAKGRVFHDANGNGKLDRKEKGIAGVSVTNGTQVVLTDANGNYSLPVGLDNIIAVIKPAGYKVPLNNNNLPRFFYIHKPNGSPALQYKGVQPTGKLPAAVDFPLTPVEEKEAFTALIFGDPQPYNLQEVDYFARGVVAEVKGLQNVALGISMGDLVGNDLSLFNPYITATKEVGIPWYNLMGNHDMNFDVKEDSLSDETYEAHFGPANYAFNYAKIHFILLDDILYPDPRDGKSYWGGFRKDQLEFIENDLKTVPKDRLIVLAFHIPLSEEGDGDAFRDEDRDKLFELLKDFPHTLSLSAHTHLQKQDFFTKKQGWKQDKPHHHYNVGTTSGDWYSGKLNEQGVPVSTMRDGTPKGYSFIHFDGTNYVIDYKVAGKPKEFQIDIAAPKVIEKGTRSNFFIYANFFMGRKGDKLEYRVDNGKWLKMEYVEEYDPNYYHDLQAWDFTNELMNGRRPSNAVQSTHLWRTAIPKNLATGTHQIEVRATDMYGRTFTGKNSFRVEEKK